ncbi:argininosuccinate lyase [bacterium]|nr:argininosuccinate lyase [bacterium]
MKLESVIEKREFVLDPASEDVHMNIEAWLARDIGPDAAGHLHTARSRNDQVATDMRLFLRERLLSLEASVDGLVASLLARAQAWLELPIPGFTHHRHGAISTVAHLCTAYAQALLRDGRRLASAHERVNRSPLGAVAGYGTSWTIDRDYAARLLGFSGVEANTLDPVSNRWELEAEVGAAVCVLLNHLSTLAQDMILLSPEEYGLLVLPEDLTTGSSVMPQKRNPDFAEVTKARAAAAAGHLAALLSLSRGNLSGYNRDTQWSKYLIIDLLSQVELAPEVMAAVVERMEWDREALERSVKAGFLYAVDLADGLAQEFHVPFRRAYRAVGSAVAHARKAGRGDVAPADLHAGLAAEGLDVQPNADWLACHCDWKHNLSRRAHFGGPAPAAEKGVIMALQEARESARRDWELRVAADTKAHEQLLAELRQLAAKS